MPKLKKVELSQIQRVTGRVVEDTSTHMIIPINLSPPPHRQLPPLEPTLAKLGSDELVLIELQGWLDVVEGEKQDGFIGNLTMENVCVI